MSSRRPRAHLARRRAVLGVAALTTLVGGCSSAGSSTASAGHSAPAASAGHYSSATAGHSSSPSARHSASGAQATLAPARRAAVADRYLAIAVPANHRLDQEVEGFADHERSDLAAAEADLRAEAATERWFDRRLATIRFRPGSPRWLAR